MEAVLKDVLAFFVSMLALIFGFAFSFHLLVKVDNDESGNLYQSPVSSFLSVLTMTVGHFGSETQESILSKAEFPGTTEIIFVFLYIVLSIGAMNILIGICLTNIKDIIMQKEDFKLGQMIINSYQTEKWLLMLAQIFRKLPCCNTMRESLSKLASFPCAGSSSGHSYKVYPHMENGSTRKESVIPLRFGNGTNPVRMPVSYIATQENCSGEEEKSEEQRTHFSLPGNLVKQLTSYEN